MKIKSAHLEDSFIPEFNENKKLPSGDQVVVEIKKHISNIQLTTYRKFSSDMKGVTSISYDDLSIVRHHVGAIKNLEDDDGKIKDGIELADSTNKLLYPLLIEIRSFLLNEGELLTEGEK